MSIATCFSTKIVREMFKKGKKGKWKDRGKKLTLEKFFSVKDTRKPGCQPHGEETGSFYQSVKESIKME